MIETPPILQDVPLQNTDRLPEAEQCGAPLSQHSRNMSMS
jgi:hypothetical protein